MEPEEDSLTFSKLPTSSPYSEIGAPSPHSHMLFLKMYLMLFSLLWLGLPNGLSVNSGFPTKILQEFLIQALFITANEK